MTRQDMLRAGKTGQGRTAYGFSALFVAAQVGRDSVRRDPRRYGRPTKEKTT